MTSVETLSEREEHILRAVVDSHISTAEAVGSRSIVKRFKLNLSPATTRNVMADLEEAGYLEQLHTSSGRVPTDRGYRYYVDHLMDIEELMADEQVRIDRDLGQDEICTEEVMRQASRLLAAVSQQAAIVQVPDGCTATVRHIEVVSVSRKRLGIMIADNIGGVRTVLVTVDQPLLPDELAQLNRFVNDCLRGAFLDQLSAALAARLSTLKDERRRLAEKALDLFNSMPSPGAAQLFMDGARQLFEQPEFRDAAKARAVVTLLEERERLTSLFRLGGPHRGPDRVLIVIGSETQEEGLDGLGEISVVGAPYRVGDVSVGVLGVLGPKRMPYARVTAVVDYTAESLGRHLTRLAS